MNKKFTFMVAALLAAGSFSANAETIDGFLGEAAKKVEGKSYFLEVGEGQYLGAQLNDEEDKIVYSLLKEGVDDSKLSKETLKKYLWSVSENKASGQVYEYKFTNALTGKTLSFVVNGDEGEEKTFTLLEDVTVKEGTITESNFRIVKKDNAGTIENGSQYTTASQFTLAGYGENDYLKIADDAITVDVNASDLTNASQITLVNIADGIDVDVEDLNDLYNSAGFNFTLNDDKLANVGNIFADKRIVALKVGNGETPVVNPEDETQSFPAGTYFATSVPRKWNFDVEGPVDDYNYLTLCTFIAVDSDNNILDDDAEGMKAGKGFTLTEVTGKDLVLYNGKEDKFKAQGNQIAVCNAVFSVKESTTEDVYKLTVPTVRALEKSGATKQVENKDLGISAAKGDSQISTGTASFIFKFAESTVEKGISFLKTDGPAIYNIKFYLSNGADDTYNGKYLTVNAKGNEYVAKGAVLADLDAPAYQWLITKVDGSNVTFTNRESGQEFTTQLFKEDGGRYSFSVKVDEGETAPTFKYYNVDENGDVVLGNKNTTNGSVSLDRKFVVLEPSKAVNYSDYLDVEDETLMTLSFGRDIAPTSNKLYPIVTKGKDDVYRFCDNPEGEVRNHRNLTDDINLAAQWLLVKAKDNGVARTNPIKRNYAYANGDLVNIKNNGDVVYAYSYRLQLVLDGKAIEGQYLTVGDPDGKELGYQGYSIGAGSIFYIQENEDGSVLLKTAQNASEYRKVDQALFLAETYNEDGTPKTIGELIDTYFESSEIDNEVNGVLSRATDVKTYLIAEAPAVSLPGNEGHYSIATELGNYITMNEERDGLTVKEETDPLYLYVTDQKAVVPSFYVTKAAANKAERMFLFNPTDSVDYYVGEGQYNKKYQLDETVAGTHPTKVIFKAASINETRDTLKTNIKGEMATVAMKANNTNKVVGGLDKFKVQIIESADADGLYVIRQAGEYVTVVNGKMAWGSKGAAQKFEITGAEAPTSNESVAASEVKVIANNGSINVKNAAGKNVVVSTILGQVVANEVLTSDNATINVPAGIVVVAVEGESFKVNVK